MELRHSAGIRKSTKRKFDSIEATERLPRALKRLSLHNPGICTCCYLFKCLITDILPELNGPKLDVPAEDPSKAAKPKQPPRTLDNDSMQLDNTTNKVYIYNLDDELSDSDSSSDESKLVFLPDIEKRLRTSRIPPSILANSEGELAGRNLHTDLVLYNVPSSLSVPEDRDSVRKAIIETRARAREKQRRDLEKERTAPLNLTNLTNGFTEVKPPINLLIPTMDMATTAGPSVEESAYDPDAMDID
jgi:hypothetical protein